MKKTIITIYIIVIGIICSVIGHITVKKYFYKNYIDKKTTNNIIQNKILTYNINPNIIEIKEEPVVIIKEKIISTTTTKTTTTRTKTTTTQTTTTTEKLLEEPTKELIIQEEKINNEDVVLDDLTLSELTEKLNKSLSSTLTNTGFYFANYYKKTGLNPYLSLAIVLQETGCKWTCSKLVRECNNIGGIKGKPSCNGGSYKKFDTLENGINGYLDMLYNNYYSKGLTTPELINPKYASSSAWSEKINNYILEIKSK